MKKTVIYTLVTLLVVFLASSCDREDILDQDPVDSFNEQSVFSDLNLIQAALGRAYDYWGTGRPPCNCQEDLLAAATDEMLCIHRPTRYTWTVGTMTPDYMRHFEDSRFPFMNWNYVYGNLKLINTILDNIDDAPAETSAEVAQRDNIKGQALFLRAWAYSNLMRTYGGVVLTDHAYKLNDDFLSITRSTYEETSDFILADCDAAIALLPDKDDQELGRATKGAAAFVKSRVLSWNTGELVNGGYDLGNEYVEFTSGDRNTRLAQARDMAKAIMDGTYGHYQLTTVDGNAVPGDPPSPMTQADVDAYADNFYNIFDQVSDWDDEVVWGQLFIHGQGTQQAMNKWYGPNGYHNWGNNDPLEPVVRKFEMADGTPFVWDAYDPGNMTTREFTAAELAADPYRNPYYGREPRFYASIFYHGAPWVQRPSDAAGIDPVGLIQSGYFVDRTTNTTVNGLDTRQGLIEAWNGTKNGYYVKKFTDPGTVGQFFNNPNTWVEFRYAEVVLDYAEACIELGGADLQNGIDALNMIRNRAGLPDRVTADQATARDYYRHERQMEMFGEGDRFWMIRKWMIADQVIENVHPMIVYEYTDATGGFRWFYDDQSDVDDREFVHHTYWLPIRRTEMNKAPQLVQNPGYN